MYPRVDIRVEDVVRNYAHVVALAEANDIGLTVVTKALTGYQPLVDCLLEAGATSLGEAHIQNLERFELVDAEKWMIRLPLISEAAEVVRYADVSLNSELTTMRALGQAAAARGKTHKVVVMVDLGDRREGVMPEDLVATCLAASRIPGVELHGVGTQFGCVSDIVPSAAVLEDFAALAGEVENRLGTELAVVSGGSSNTLGLLAAGLFPQRINHLRIGEGWLTGKVADFNTLMPGCACPFTLSAEIVEIQEKPAPVGDRPPGVVPVSEDPLFPDRGIRRRALVAIGKQDVGLAYLTPRDPGVTVEAGSSDVFAADITDSETAYRVGDVLTFDMDYFAILPAMVSQFVEKRLV